MKFLALLSTLAALGTVSALPNPKPAPEPIPYAIPEAMPEELEAPEPILVKRDPKDKSGKSQMVLQCEGTTLPQPGGANGEGEGGASYFYSNLVFNADGKKINPKGCTKQSSTCDNCLFEGGGLSSPTNVTGCWNPPGGKRGCSIDFQYNGHHYNSQDKQDACGHQSGFQPFAFDLSAICYFNV
ncbi:hypothetical protein N7492_004073 [Penicillium capsulatum]|uniref:IgE-binding protein n=1 Tax=Penicillium capsulatum TaxID=69766 RepID=A0A9W9LWU2_9EURO|nr:hypothetical protein N7492_004073 [Penicillium capsulatum]KAJ6121354.1 hypothetical protein N7512_003819 [Penicillium capsulatum]